MASGEQAELTAICRQCGCRPRKDKYLHKNCTIHGEQRLLYPCPHCQCRYSTYHTLNRHVRSNHPEAMPLTSDLTHDKSLLRLSEVNGRPGEMEPLGLEPLPQMKPRRGGKNNSLASPSQMVLTGSMVRLGNTSYGSPAASSLGSGSVQRFPKFHEFQCPLCPRSYAQKCSLYRHMKVHKDDKINEAEVQQQPCTTGDGTYKCPFCIASYSNSASLNVHVRTHAVGYRDMVKKPENSMRQDEEKLFPCPLCSRVFQRRSRLTVHLNISHRNEQYGDLPRGEGEDGDVESELDEPNDLDDNDPIDLSSGSRTGSVSPPMDSSPGGALQGNFMCHLCGCSYTRRTNLNKHLEKRHNVDPSVLMAISSPEFPVAAQGLLQTAGRPADYNEEMKEEEEEEEGQERRGEDEDEERRDLDDKSTVHQCPFCSFDTTHRYSLYRHMTVVHSDKADLQEKMMEKVVEGMSGAEDGVLADKDDGLGEGNEEIFPCSFCSRVYMRKCNLTQHLKMHFHDEAELKKKRIMDPPDALRERMEQFCNDVEEEVEEVRRIIELTKAQTSDDKNSVHECAICGLTFGIKVSLILHLKMHERRALSKMKEKESQDSPKKSPSKIAAALGSPGPLLPPGMPLPIPPMMMPPMPRGAVPAGGPNNPSMYVMTQDKDGKTTIHNQQAYMLSHLQVLNQVQHMIRYGRQAIPPPHSPGNLPPAAIPKKRMSTGSLDEDMGNHPKKLRPGPKPGRHWKSLECDPNRRPVKKCSLCTFEISDTNQEGLLQHMAAIHGVSCKLCPGIKFFTKRDFDYHCSQAHSLMCQASEMEQLMVFGEIMDSGHKMELVDPKEKDGETGLVSPSIKTEVDDRDTALTNDADSPPPSLIPVKQEHQAKMMSPPEEVAAQQESPAGAPFNQVVPMRFEDGEPQSMLNTPMRQVCPKCGLHYAQKSSLNRHIRTHHNYSRVEEIVKAENIPQPQISVPRPSMDPAPRSKEVVDKGLLPPPLIPITQGMSPVLPPPLIPINSAIPAQGMLTDINPNVASRLMFGGGGFLHSPPSSLPGKNNVIKRHLMSTGIPPVLKQNPFTMVPLKNEEEFRSTSPDQEVTAINLSMNTSPYEAEDLSSTASKSSSPASMLTATKGRSRRKPQVVQRIVRNPTLEEEEEEEGHRAGSSLPTSYGSSEDFSDDMMDEDFESQGFTDSNANHINDKPDQGMDTTAQSLTA